MSNGQPKFTTLSNSYGIKGINIENENQLNEALTKYKNYPFPILFDCLVVENENCYPMVSPGATNAAMTGIKYKHDELELLKRHYGKNDDIDTFLQKIPN